MPHQSPESYSLATYAWVIGLSMAGGVASFMRNIRDGKARPFNIAEFFGEIFTSSFVGILTFYLAEHAGFDQTLTAALVGISGHMGSRAINILEGQFTKRFGGSSDDKVILAAAQQMNERNDGKETK